MAKREVADRPSPLPSLRTLIERTMTVADLVSAPLWSLDPSMSATDAASMLAALDFDVAGVSGEPVTAYVTRGWLISASGTVGEAAQPIPAADAVERSLSLADFVQTLRERSHVFILDHDHVGWVATHADLQAPAVSVVVLSYLVAIEVGLSDLVRKILGDGWFDLLPIDSQTRARELYELKLERNVATGLEDCLYFKDWFHIVRRSKKLLADLGYSSGRAFDKATGSFADLRNDLAHGGTLLDGAAPLDAIDRFTRIRSFAESVWDLLEQQHDRWDAYAGTILTTDDNRILNGPEACPVFPFPTPAHVLTAWNPGSRTLPLATNRNANRELQHVLDNHGLEAVNVIGSSPDGNWSEESLLITGSTRRAAAELGERFGQTAIFELTSDHLRVVRCRDGRLIREVPRRSRA